MFKKIVILIIFSIYLLEKVDLLIILFLIKNSNLLLYKYRDYIKICKYIPNVVDRFILFVVLILYVPISLVLLILLKNYDICKPLKLSKNMAYNGVLPYVVNDNLSNKTFNKLYWNNVFNKLNIPTPKMVGLINNGDTKFNNNYNPNKTYIIKNIYGCCGNSVSIYNSNNKYQDGIYIIQDFIQKSKSMSETYRINTTYINSLVIHIEIYNFKNNKITSNVSSGGKSKHLMSLLFPVKSTNKQHNKINNALLYDAIKNAIKAHIHIYKKYKCLTFGWDVILNEKPYFLEGNIGVTVNYKYYDLYIKKFCKNELIFL